MNKLNYKLINILVIILIIISLLYLFNSYSNSLNVIRNIINPIILSFFLAFSFYPVIKVINKKFSYNISCFIFITLFLFFSFISFFFLYNVLKEEFYNAILDISKFIEGSSYINFDIKKYLLSTGSFNLLSNSYSYFIEIILIIVLIIYFIFNMENIRNFLLRYNIFIGIDNDLFSYYKGFYIVIIIESLEHLILYFIIGHPYFLLLGMLSIITSLIPIIGSIVLNIFALISAYFISDTLFIMTSIILIVLPLINNYLVEPKVYNKTLNISFISIILSCFIFGSLFGFIGLILSIPFYIIIKNIYNYYKNKNIWFLCKLYVSLLLKSIFFNKFTS